jgi:hypothetical protein
VVCWLLTAGDQVPVKLFDDVAGKLMTPPAQIGAIAAKVA